ncbi:glycosyl hydrolase [Paraburkholderia megapolitana]|uniref:Glycosyl hydrolase catalytic core n=1 Tax=Paraburkholderia megapolitana TaxID=420953 RepID=A0A1I3P0D5_9BURK|nr:glycosyl hydrolase [Paraburkholderia megapolitana]QDQ84552.1 hypothetical protein FNZ07_26090 [Paraburkholderia megapolitana]SFJ14802.1 Glycosyl hydrolase catalytic core [Paraburkholderia megapolitana]
MSGITLQGGYGVTPYDTGTSPSGGINVQQIEQIIQELLAMLQSAMPGQNNDDFSSPPVGGASGANAPSFPQAFANAPPPPPPTNTIPQSSSVNPPGGASGAVAPSGATSPSNNAGSAPQVPANYAFLSSGKEGLGISPTSANGNGSNMGDSSWYSNWGMQSTGDAKGQFIPTVFNTNDASNEGQLESAFKSSGSPLAFTFNEPDNAGQANISVGDAVKSWSNIATAANNTGTQLASPSVTNSTNPGEGLDWLKQFMNSDTTVNGQTKKVGDTVSAINLHWYGSTGNPNDPGQVGQAVNNLKSYLEQAHSEFPDKPIVLSEFGLNPNGNSAASSPEFLKQAEQMLNSLPYVEMYAPYGLGTPGGNASASSAT